MLCALLGGFSLLLPAPAAAVSSLTGTQTAYWWQPEPLTGLVPVPGVPANGMYVASSPSGPQAISALQIANHFAGDLVRLTLHVAQRQVLNAPVIAVYHVTSSWQAGGPQVWSSRPAYDGADLLARGALNLAQTAMTIVLPANALTEGVVLVPAVTPGATTGASFALSFAAPSAGDLQPVARPSTSPSRGVLPVAHPTRTPSHSPSARRHPTPRTHRSTPTPSARASRHHRAGSHTSYPLPPSPVPPAAERTTSAAGPGTRDLIVVLVAAAVIVAAGAVLAVKARGRGVRRSR